MAQKRRFDVRENDVWVGNAGHRRVVAVVGGAVAYSVGSNTNRICKVETFRRFARSAQLQYRKAD